MRSEAVSTGENSDEPSRGLPEGWVAATMEDIADIIGGGTPDAKDETNFTNDGGIAWLTPADLSGFADTFISRGRRNLTSKGFSTSSARLLPKGSVLMSSRAPIGYLAIAANEIATNQGFKSFVCTGAVLPEYVYYWLRYMTPTIESMGSGSTFVEVSGSKAREIPVRFPPLAEQRRIVEKVEALLARVNAARKRLTHVVPLTKELRKRVIAAACSGSLTKDWREQVDVEQTAAQLLARLVRTTQDLNARRRRPFVAPAVPRDGVDLPATWTWATPSQVSRLDVGFAFKSTEFRREGTRLLRGENIEPGKLRWIEVQYWPADRSNEFRDLFVEEGEVILALDRPLISSGLKIARATHADIPAILVQRVMRFKPAEPEISAFLYLTLQTPEFVESLQQGGLTGTDLPHITGTAVAEFTFPLPPLVEQRVIVERVDSLMRLLDAIDKRVNAALARADKVRPAILAKAFAGELVPTEAELARRENRKYEPASVLLERTANERKPATNASRSARKRSRRA